MSDHQSNNIWLFLETLAKRRSLILFIVVIATIGAVVVSLLLPKWYQAKALLLPPKDTQISLGNMDMMAEAYTIATGLNLPVMATPTDVYARMLKSRSVAEKIIDKYSLQEYYKARSFEETYDALYEFARIGVTGEGLLEIAVEDRDPQMAADIANEFIEALDQVNQELIKQRIEQTKSFVSERLEQVKTELDSARAEMERFQIKYKTVDFDEQTRLAIDQAVQLKIALAETDLNLRMNELNLGKDNPELQTIRKERDIIKQQIQELETENSDSSFFSLPVASIPSLKGQYEVLLSDVKVSEALYQVLLQQREQNKLREFEKLPTISVLDHAKVPEIKSKPQRSYIVLGTVLLSLIFAVLLAILIEYLTRLKESAPDDYDRAMYFLSSYFGWLPGIKRKK